MKRTLFMVVFLALLLLSACNEQITDVTWTEVDVPSFDWYQATGITEGSDFTDIDISKLRFDINADPDIPSIQTVWLQSHWMGKKQFWRATLKNL